MIIQPNNIQPHFGLCDLAAVLYTCYLCLRHSTNVNKSSEIEGTYDLGSVLNNTIQAVVTSDWTTPWVTLLQVNQHINLQMVLSSLKAQQTRIIVRSSVYEVTWSCHTGLSLQLRHILRTLGHGGCMIVNLSTAGKYFVVITTARIKKYK